MSNFDLKGLQTLALRLNSDALGTLAADTTLSLTNLSGISRGFLCKKVMYMVAMSAAATNDMVIIGLANSTATVAEITTALSSMNISDPNNATNRIKMDQWKVVWYESLRILQPDATGAGIAAINDHFSVGGGKGIPWTEDGGIQVFVYNPSTSALTTGALIDGLVAFQGIWFND